jgi:hypothetical protein
VFYLVPIGKCCKSQQNVSRDRPLLNDRSDRLFALCARKVEGMNAEAAGSSVPFKMQDGGLRLFFFYDFQRRVASLADVPLTHGVLGLIRACTDHWSRFLDLYRWRLGELGDDRRLFHPNPKRFARRGESPMVSKNSDS